MTNFVVSRPAKWEQFLKGLTKDHEIDIYYVVSELCEWTFSGSESREQFRLWLDDAFPQRGEVEDEARAAGEEASAEEEQNEEESEEESHDHRDWETTGYTTQAVDLLCKEKSFVLETGR
jgi:hypothetical protein